jgi:hypothetical protein
MGYNQVFIGKRSATLEGRLDLIQLLSKKLRLMAQQSEK